MDAKPVLAAPRRAGHANAVDKALAFAAGNRSRHIEELKELIRFPRVGGQSAHAPDMTRCAGWLASHLGALGFAASVLPTSGHPLVLGEWRGAAGAPTLLVYGHYDVQPAEPVDEWTSPPFVPTVRGRDLYGRGACDDKGQLWTHVKAFESWLRTSGRLPVNVVCLLEGKRRAAAGGCSRGCSVAARSSASMRPS
jgi:acetylornithine deacetylase/succinyl-diaminopimelate desuccinylase-like protein